ncbi:DUF2867 domain-containing protein [Microbacterium sp. NIBRBAC000506063]|uniref:DUF2867 domain-containing protein n=1 Tax=Microbacterium sp. NIBRBAC000506063 TaxID=2734618 RepID=UPI001BB491D7|nr:DUF2867 domain-containing protein [Microbacterium sp. NIBRBAC000506063]QTV79622.1 DUF2867 domain-containing protein [Microbacterium sp. NIBRBAC000506063]
MPTQEPTFTSLAFGQGRFDYGDVLLASLPPRASRDPRAWAETMFSPRSTPWPVKALFGIRMVLVPLLGLRPAPRGVFDVREVKGEEALLAFDDDHLDFRCAVAVDPTAEIVRVTTVVRLRNGRGRLYFAPVSLLHPFVVHAMLRRARRILAGEGTAAGRA